jgi:hypothetical protein
MNELLNEPLNALFGERPNEPLIQLSNQLPIDSGYIRQRFDASGSASPAR